MTTGRSGSGADVSEFLKLLAENEYLVDMKQRVRFGAFVMCGLVNCNVL